MPELAEMRALAERVGATLAGRTLTGYEALGFSGLKTVSPRPDELVGRPLAAATSRGKYLVLSFGDGGRILVHLSQAGRVDLESPAKSTRPRGGVVRLVFGDDALLVREYGSERKAGWWVLAAGDDGPLAALGPEPAEEAFADLLIGSDDSRQLHTVLRDQRTVAGVGRGYVDDALNLAGLSPFVSLRSLTPGQRSRLVEAVRAALAEGLERERTRSGGLSEARLGDRFAVHNRAGQPCPRCGETLLRVSFASHEIVYCKSCQTNGRVLADRRLSRLLR
ncbi:MAG TPA: DNA-formamidopyrimidine glycosylase family protein [Acidimicrobiales bacterium]|nr:DNA-formamidopyrimidine glycosylase family protein [Acidimicrobiales bacterium]